MVQNLVELLVQLISFKSLSGQEQPCMEFMAQVLSKRDFAVERLSLEDGRTNIFALVGTPNVIFTTHLDVVPAPEALFSPQLTEAKVIGRGACDAKGIAACMVEAAVRLRAAGARDFGLLFVVGEELDGAGAKAAATALQGRGIRYLVNGEPTEGKLMRAHKGVLTLRITTRGKSAHSGYPECGVSATLMLVRLLERLSRVDLGTDAELGNTTFNIGTIEGGVAGNVLAPSASALCCIRPVLANSEVLARVREEVGSQADVQVLYDVPAVRLSTVPGFDTAVAAYGTDIPNFTDLGAACLLYGPGSIHEAHTDGESVAIEELEQAVDGYQRLFHALHR